MVGPTLVSLIPLTKTSIPQLSTSVYLSRKRVVEA